MAIFQPRILTVISLYYALLCHRDSNTKDRIIVLHPLLEHMEYRRYSQDWL